MNINSREFNGIFQARSHTSANRLLWLLFNAISLSVIACGVWVIQTDLFDISHETRLKYFEIALVCSLFLVGPAIVFVIGLTKIFKKPGIYFQGVRITSKGIEIGRFSLQVNPESPKEIWNNKIISDDMVSEWKQIKRCDCNALKILIVLSKRYKLTKQLMLERVVFSSMDTYIFQMYGNDSSGLHWNDIYAISHGSLHLLGNFEGIYPSDLSFFRERTAAIISKWKYSFVLSCSLKTIPSLANLDRVLAFGVLGGVNTMNEKTITNEGYQEKIFDSRKK